MTSLRSPVAITAIATSALMALILIPGKAAACSANGGSAAQGACCSGGAECACCCEPASVESRLPFTDRSIVYFSAGTGVTIPNRPCECRFHEPSEPASKSEFPSSERQLERDDLHSAKLGAYGFPGITPARLVHATESPPRAPLYIRTSRILI
jgi:hypothetical protein